MSLWRDVRELLEMYRSGGLVIMTGMDGMAMETAVSQSAASYTGKEYDHAGIRTVIQLDSDYVTVMTPAVLEKPDLWHQHMQRINEKLAVLDKLQELAKKSWMLFMLLPILWYGYDFTQIKSVEDLWRLILPTILSAVIVLARKWILRFLQKFILPLVTRFITWIAKRQFKHFVGDMR